VGKTFLDVVQPTGTILQGAWAVTGAPTVHEALQSAGAYAGNASYIQMLSDASVGKVSFGPAPVLGTGVRVKFIRIHVTGSVSHVNFPLTLRVDLTTSRGSVPVELTGFFLSPTFVTLTVDVAAAPGGGAWSEDDLDELAATFVARRGDPVLSFSRLSIGVWVNNPPTLAIVGPGSVTTTSFPFVTWSFSDTDLVDPAVSATTYDTQESVEVKIFSGATAVADPSTETARLISYSGEVYTADTSIQTSGLSNGSYRVAIRGRDFGSGTSDWGAWTQASMTVNNPAPNAPTLIVTPDSTNNLHTITVASGGGTYPPETFIIERSDDYGTTWAPVRNGTLVATAFPVSMFDYEAPRMARPSTLPSFSSVLYNEPVAYDAAINYNESPLTSGSGPQPAVRYRATAARVVAGETILSAYTTVTPEALVGDATTWLKHPYDEGLSIVIQHMANWESTSEEDLAALRSAGRRDWVVFGDVPSLERGDLDIVFPGDAAWENFEALRAPADGVAASPLLLQTCFGDTILKQMWVRLGPSRSVVNVTHRDQNVLQYRRAKVGFFETVRPLVD
jgi:hypothetical protein